MKKKIYTICDSYGNIALNSLAYDNKRTAETWAEMKTEQYNGIYKFIVKPLTLYYKNEKNNNNSK